MKKNNIIVVLLAIAAMVCSCQKEIEGNYSNLVKVSFSAGRPVATRTDISSTGAVTWNALDHLAVFTDVDGSNVYDFSVSSMNPEQTVAEFDGSVPSNGSRTAAYVLYPYAAGYIGGPAALEVEVPATQADGTNYTLMAAKGSVAGDDFASASMTMKHLCWIYDVNITNPSSKSIKAVHFSAGSAVFGTAGTVDLTSATPAVSATSSAKTVTVQFATAKTTDVTARFVLLPLSCADVDFNMHVEFEDGFYETFAIGSKTLDIAAGVRKSNTWTLGTGVMSNAPWGWYFVASGTNIGTAISAAKTALGSNDVKLYLESSPSESMNYATTARIYPTGSIWIDSNPANMKPTIEQGAVTFFEPKTDASIGTLSVRNVNLYAKDALSEGYLFYISSTDYTGVSVGSLEFDNCTISNYKHSMVRIVSGLSGGARIRSISMNNCVYKVKSSYGGAYAFVHLSNNTDRVEELSFTNSTFEGLACFLYDNLSSGNQENPFVLSFENNTVANTKSSSNKYFFNIQNAISGTTSIKDNLFVGSNGNSGVTYRMLREGNTSNFTNTFANNWYATDWLNFTVDEGSGCLNFLTDASASNSAALCPGAGSSDFTLSASDVKTASAGDPRWL